MVHAGNELRVASTVLDDAGEFSRLVSHSPLLRFAVGRAFVRGIYRPAETV
jgi:hypothetical protein